MNNIYEDIAKRTQGDIYIGVVGPVRTGKSTFIRKFMETLVLPNIENEFKRDSTATVYNVVFKLGRVICVKHFHSLAPSTLAASYTLSGIQLKPASHKTIL